MRFVVRHETLYQYSAPVVLAPHILRLTPRSEHQLRERALRLRPEPRELRDETDEHGNLVTRVIFPDHATRELHIESCFSVDTVTPPGERLTFAPEPLPWTGPLVAELEPYRPADLVVDPAVAAFARGIAAEVAQDPLAFLDALCTTMHARADKHVRPTGEAQAARDTLASWRGACRDFTVLFLAAARSLGMPARFCSGYQAAAETPDGRRYLHAWPEVFVPGSGWRGWDPTHGIPVGAGHVALCAAPEQVGTMPVHGGFYFEGASVTSTLDFDLRITTT
jgi:transglutaminase-like putative cysteine protease